MIPYSAQPVRNALLLNSAALSKCRDCGMPCIGHERSTSPKLSIHGALGNATLVNNKATVAALGRSMAR